MTAATARPRPPRAARAARERAGAREPARVLPVARVLVDVPLAHLDRPYDYVVPEPDSDDAVPGARVRVRFAGRMVNGFVLARLAESDHQGRLGFLERVVSAEPVLTPEIAELARAVADRYAGSLADVLRLAVPPRHAKTEIESRSLVPVPVPVPVPVDGAADNVVALHSAPQAAPIDCDHGAGAGRVPRAGPTTRMSAEYSSDPVPTGPSASPTATVTASASPKATASASPTATVTASASPKATASASPTASASAASSTSASASPTAAGPVSPAGWQRYSAGTAFLDAVRNHRPARGVWQALPGEDWPARLAQAAAVAADAGRGALLIVPDARDLARLDTALLEILGPERHVTLSADLGPAERYRRFLTISRGERRVVAGTRAAVFAPVAELGLVAVFDDGDDLLAEPRAPYPHAREVLMLRSAATSCALLVGGFARTAEAQLLVESGWAQPIVAGRSVVRAAAPRIEAAGDEYAVGADSAAAGARLTPAAFAAARAALDSGAPVLVQVPRRGYLPVLACTRCRARAQCRHCRGPLAKSGASGLLCCRWCGIAEAHFRCAACGFDRLRAVTVGAGRTAEELGRAFPGVTVVNSSGQKVKSTVPDAAAMVIATPGAEPYAPNGYGAALLLDGSAMLARPDLRAAEETMRRWMAAAAMVRPAGEGGRVIVGADASIPVVQALIRWDPVGHAAAELAGRRELGFPPVAAMASIEGEESAVLGVLDRLALPPDGEVLGPVALDDLGADTGSAPTPGKTSHRPGGSTGPGSGDAGEPDFDDIRLRALVRAPQSQRKALSSALHAVAAARSARKEGGGVRIRVDPLDLF